MSKEVIWSNLAENDIEKLTDYLLCNWQDEVCKKFLIKLNSDIVRITTNPSQFPFLNKKKGYRKCIISKHNTLFYKEYDYHILILRIYDTRQDFKKMKME